MKSRITKLLAIACVFALLVGSFAYFTDRAELSTADNKSGNVKISVTDFAGETDGILKDREGKNNLNPGDVRDLTFTVSNLGNKAVDLRHTIKLTVTDKAGAAKALVEDAGQAQFDIYLASDISYTDAAGYQILNDAKPIFSTATLEDNDADGNGVKRTLDGNTITYYFASTTLLGKDGKINSERGATASADAKDIDVADSKDAVTYGYKLVYRGNTDNSFMDSVIDIDMIVEAKQHYNTNNNWTVIATESATAGANNLAGTQAAPFSPSAADDQ